MDTNKIDERFEDLDRKVAALGHYSSELRRKAAGITRANRAAAMGERNLAQLSEDVAGLRARFDNLGPVAGPAQSEAILAELKRLDTRLDALWSDLNAELEKLRGRVDEHDKRLDDHELKFASHGERIEGVEVIVGSHATAIASLRNTARGQHNVHPIAWVLGIIAGILAGWAWAVHDWSQTTTLNGVKTVVENTAADNWWAAVICGLCVGGFTWALFAFLLPSEGEEQAQTTTATANAGAGAAVRFDRSAPTMVQPAVPAPPPPPPAASRSTAGVY
ncbi:MAG TPA: hypothetical protein PJ984_04010 [Candidatus Saccharibacteria bacterium]|nr:hypothetical protein [Candidatus Saccharibacteria bacterium]